MYKGSLYILSTACESIVVSIETNNNNQKKKKKPLLIKGKDKPDWGEIFKNYFIKDPV